MLKLSIAEVCSCFTTGDVSQNIQHALSTFLFVFVYSQYVMVSKGLFRSVLNYVLRLSFLLLSLQDEYLANRLLEYLMEHSHHDNRSVFRNNLEIIKTLVECWREKLQGPTK